MHTCTMYDSIQHVPPDVWRCLVTEVDFAMDRRLVTLQQRTLREQSRMWVVVVRMARMSQRQLRVWRDLIWK